MLRAKSVTPGDPGVAMIYRDRMPVEEYLKSPINHPSLVSKVRPMFDLTGTSVEYLFIQEGDLWRKVKDGEELCVLNGSPSVVS